MKEKLPLVSIIVPIFKIEKYIGLCIESLLHQTYSNIEIILVNDGSPDRCLDICNIYQRKDKRIKIISKENGGLVSARQAGLEQSTGELICNVDGDDWVDAEFVEALVRAQLEFDADAIVAGQTRHFFDNKVMLKNRISCGFYEGEKLNCLKSRMMSYGNYYSIGIYTYLWNKLFKREIIYKHQMSVDRKISQGEDAAVVYPALNDCRSVCVIDDCSYHYRQREDSMLKSTKDFSLEAPNIRCLYKHLCRNLPGECQEQIDDYILHIFTVRSGGITAAESLLYPYNVNFDGKRLVLCSAGTFGQQLFGKLKSQNCDIVAWIDDDYWAYRRCCLDVDPIDIVQNLEYDYAIIAALDFDAVSSLTQRLRDFGVEDTKILTVNRDKKERKRALIHYLSE